MRNRTQSPRPQLVPPPTVVTDEPNANTNDGARAHRLSGHGGHHRRTRRARIYLLRHLRRHPRRPARHRRLCRPPHLPPARGPRRRAHCAARRHAARTPECAVPRRCRRRRVRVDQRVHHCRGHHAPFVDHRAVDVVAHVRHALPRLGVARDQGDFPPDRSDRPPGRPGHRRPGDRRHTGARPARGLVHPDVVLQQALLRLHRHDVHLVCAATASRSVGFSLGNGASQCE